MKNENMKTQAVKKPTNKMRERLILFILNLLKDVVSVIFQLVLYKFFNKLNSLLQCDLALLNLHHLLAQRLIHLLIIRGRARWGYSSGSRGLGYAAGLGYRLPHTGQFSSMRGRAYIYPSHTPRVA